MTAHQRVAVAAGVHQPQLPSDLSKNRKKETYRIILLSSRTKYADICNTKALWEAIYFCEYLHINHGTGSGSSCLSSGVFLRDMVALSVSVLPVSYRKYYFTKSC